MKEKIFQYLINKIPSIKYLFADRDNKEVIKGTTTTLCLKTSGYILSIVFNIILARIYGADVVGILALSLSAYGIASIFSVIGTEISSVRFIAQYVTNGKYQLIYIYKKILRIVIPLSVIIGTCLFFLSPLVANKVFHKPMMTIPIRIFALIIPFGAIQKINMSSLRGLKKIRESIFFQTVFPPLVNIITLIMITYIFIKNYITPIYANALTIVIACILTTIVWLRKILETTLSTTPKQETSLKSSVEVPELLKVSIPMFLSSSMFLIMKWADIFILGMYRSSHEVGIYRIASKIAWPTSFVLVAVISIVAPKFSELFFNNKKKEVEKVAKFSSKLAFFLSFPIILSIVFFAKPILSIFGTAFIYGSQSLIVLLFGQLFHVYFGTNGTLLNMTGFEKEFGLILLVGVILNIILNIVLIPKFGIIGAAFATALSTTCWNLIASIFIYKNYGFWISYIPRFGK